MHSFKIKHILFLLISLWLFTGCLNDPSCDPVDETFFLDEYAQRDGVVKLPSGLMYKVLEASEGEKPKFGSIVFVKYRGKLVTGQFFADTREIDFFQLNEATMPGILEALQQMNEGSKFEFVIPPELGYANDPPENSPVRCGSVLIFEMNLDSFLRDPDQFLAQNALRDDVNVTPSGLQYRVIENGEGDNASFTDQVRIRYKGTFTNGYIFDQTEGTSSASFPVGGVIPGFSEALQLMNRGAKLEIFIPPNLGYPRDPNPRTTLDAIISETVLVFEVELLNIL